MQLMCASVAEIRQSLASKRGQAFVTSYMADASFEVPRDLDLGDYSIVLCEVAYEGPNLRVRMYWESEERSLAQEARVCKALALRAEGHRGSVVSIVGPKKPEVFRDPRRWGQWLVSAAAVFGALSVVRDHFAEVFYPPNVYVYASPAMPTDYHVGDNLNITMLVRNQAGFGTANVSLESAALKSANKQDESTQLQLEYPKVSHLDVGPSVEFHVFGIAPAHLASEAGPQKFNLEILARAKQGFLYPEQKIKFSDRTILIWPDKSSQAILKSIAPDGGSFNIVLWTGRAYPKGIRGQIVSLSAASPEIDHVTLISGAKAVGPVIVSEVPNLHKFQTKFEFQTDELKAFQRYPLSVKFGYKRAMNLSEWRDTVLATNLQLE